MLDGSPSLGSCDRNIFSPIFEKVIEINLSLSSRKQNDTMTRKQEKKQKITHEKELNNSINNKIFF
jgi:hypothetical protein